jgi:MFS family permease
MGLTIGSHGLVHFFEGVLPPLIPLVMAEFNTDYFHVGLVVTVFSYAFGLGSLPAGILADRFGPRRLVTFYLFVAGLFAILVWPTRQLWLYAVMMGGVGLGCSTYHPASNTLLSLSIAQRGNAFGIHGIAGSLGVAGAPVLAALIGTALGWRAPHVLFGLMGIALGFYSLRIPEVTVARLDSHSPEQSSSNPSKGFDLPALVFFFLSATALGLTYKGIMTFLPTYLGQNVQVGFAVGDPVALGGIVATVALVSGALGQFMAGRLVDRFAAEKLYLGAVLIGMLCVFMMAVSTNVWLVAFAVVYAFFYFSTQPVQNFIISNYLPKHRHGMGYGVHFFLTFGVGSTAAAVSGYLADHFGLQAVFWSMGGCFMLSALMISLLMIRNGKTALKQAMVSDHT